MPAFCAVVGCGSRSNRDPISFFRFPSAYTSGRYAKLDPLAQERRQRWIAVLCRENLTESILNNQRICSKHFITGKPSKLEDKEHPDWVPSLLLGYGSKHSESSLDRYHRAKRRLTVITPCEKWLMLNNRQRRKKMITNVEETESDYFTDTSTLGLVLKNLQGKNKKITNVEETESLVMKNQNIGKKNLQENNKKITSDEETESASESEHDSPLVDEIVPNKKIVQPEAYSYYCKESSDVQERDPLGSSESPENKAKIGLILKNQQTGKKNLQENNKKITSDEETESASESERDSPLVDEIVPNKKIVQPEDYSYYCKESSDVQERDPLGSSESPENKAKIEKIKKHLLHQVQTRVQWRRMSTDEWENTTFGPTRDSCDLIDAISETLAYEDYPCKITSPESSVKYYPCKFCTYLFMNRVELNSHVSKFHKPFITDVNLKINDFASNECGYTAKDQKELSRHKNRIYYYFCPFCMFRSSNNSGVSSHIILDHSCGSNVWCTFCDHNYCISIRNHNHRQSYKKSLFESDYCCEGCNFTCLREETFLLHIFDTHCFD